VSVYNAYMTLSGAIDGEVRQGERLARHVSYRIGGPADLFVTCESYASLALCVSTLDAEGVPWVILGKGSNVLVSDRGYRGCVICLSGELARIAFGQDGSVTAGAAVPLARLVNQTLTHELSGIEHLVGIPGTVGGAITMNAGSRREWIGSVVRDVVVLRPGKGLHRYLASDVSWGYRQTSIPPREVILETTLELVPSTRQAVSAEMERRLVRRRSSQPLAQPSCGSVFRNPDDGASVGELIESCGLKGYSHGGAKVSEVHANFIVNTGGATSDDVIAVIRHVHETVREVRGYDLETEVRFLGFGS
jgi:UDP-N-acetylmuramate dehydrogenase